LERCNLAGRNSKSVIDPVRVDRVHFRRVEHGVDDEITRHAADRVREETPLLRGDFSRRPGQEHRTEKSSRNTGKGQP
jgi:hypothetical protein